MAEEAKSGEAKVPEAGPAAHPVIAAAEEKLAAVEAGEYMDVDYHQAIRAKHMGEGAYTAEQLAELKGGDKDG